MSYYSSPEELAANPPESWRVVKRMSRRWGLFIDSSDEPLSTFATKREALAERDDPKSYARRMVEQERRWYEGETPAGWNSYAECLAERERTAAYQAKRAAERAA